MTKFPRTSDQTRRPTIKNEIVAIRNDKQIITNNPEMVFDAIMAGTVEEYVTRTKMQLMAAFMSTFDLELKWKQLAEADTLFVVETDDSGNVIGVSGQEAA